MIFPIAILVAAGCAMVGHVVGLGAFAALFEPLRHYDLDAILDSQGTLENFRRAFAVVGGIVGVWLLLRWRSMDLLVKRRLPTVRALVLATLAGAGGTMATYAGDVAGLAVQYLKVSPEHHIGLTLGSALLALLVGAGISVGYGRGYRPLPRFFGWSALGCALGFGLLLAYFVFDFGLSEQYRKLGETKTVLIDVRLPASVDTQPDLKTVRVALRSGDNTERGVSYFWHKQDGRMTLRTSVDIAERTRDRTIVFSRDGQIDRLFRLETPANPRRFHEFTDWRPMSVSPQQGDQPAPVTEDGDHQIRYLIR